MKYNNKTWKQNNQRKCKMETNNHLIKDNKTCTITSKANTKKYKRGVSKIWAREKAQMSEIHPTKTEQNIAFHYCLEASWTTSHFDKKANHVIYNWHHCKYSAKVQMVWDTLKSKKKKTNKMTHVKNIDRDIWVISLVICFLSF